MVKECSVDHLMAELRERVGRSTQRAVAAELGVSAQHLNDLFNGRREMSERIAEAMGYKREIVFRKAA